MSKPETPSDKFRVDIQVLREAAQVPGRNTLHSLWILAFLFILALGLSSLWMDTMAHREIAKLEMGRNRSRARVLASLVKRDFDRANTVLVSVMDRRLFQRSWEERNLDDIRRHLRDVLELEPAFLFASVYTPDGTLIAIEPTDPIVGKNYGHRDWFRGVTAGYAPYVSEVYRTDASPNPLVVAMAVPIRSAGQTVGILMAPCTVHTMEEKLRELEGNTNGAALVLDQNGVLIASTNALEAGKPLPDQAFTTRVLAGQEGAEKTDWAGEEMIAGYAPVPAFRWAVIYTRPAALAMELGAALRGWGLAIGGFLILIYLITIGIALNLVRKQAALLTANVSLNERLQAAREHLEERVRERTTALAESERQYRLLFEGNPQPMWIYDRETLAFLAVNNTAIQYYGYSREEFLAMTIKDIRPPETVPALLHRVSTAPPERTSAGIWKHRKKDGSLIDVEVSSYEITWQGRAARMVLAFDVTEREQMQKQYLQSQKMEAVGHLAGGIAHDFNNLLGVILGYCELLLMSNSVEGPGKMHLEEVKKAGERAATLTRQLLAFSRKQIVEPVVLDVNALVTEMSKMLIRLIGEDIQLIIVQAPGLGRVKADPGQMEQVLMNLAVNARDAMPRGGKLTIETANVELDEKYAQKHLSVAPGEYVMLAVSDTGFGMDEDTQSHIFEPFFTTKSAEKGTGLGLATVYGIVKQGGGNIWVYSEAGRGTTFKIYLPRAHHGASADALRAADAGMAPRGMETILVVEDAAPMRKMACEFLASRGYTVLEAKNGQEALEQAANHAGRIHLLLTDVVMPGMAGRELAERMLRTYPGIKVVYMSGYTGDAVVRNGILEGAASFIQKPFTLHGLAVRVRETLDSSDGSLSSPAVPLA